jgi:hypothetical protein
MIYKHQHRSPGQTPGLFFNFFYMNTVQLTILKLDRELISAFAMLDSLSDLKEDKPIDKQTFSWSYAEVLHHIVQTNDAILPLLKKTVQDREGVNSQHELRKYVFDDTVSKRASNEWYKQWMSSKPPTVKKSVNVRRMLRDQLYEYLCFLDEMAKGRRAVLDKAFLPGFSELLDTYQVVYFLILYINCLLKHSASTSPATVV